MRVPPSAGSGGTGSAELRFANWIGYIDIADDGSYPTIQKFQTESGVTVDYIEAVNANDEFFASNLVRPADRRQADRLGPGRPDGLDDRPPHPPRLAGGDRRTVDVVLRAQGRPACGSSRSSTARSSRSSANAGRTHLCFGNYKALAVAPRRYTPMFPEFLDIKVDEIHLEMASREFAEIELIAQIAKRMDVSVGIIDVKSYYVETVDDVAERVRLCLRHAPAERLSFAPDCGLSQTARWAAKQKLVNMWRASGSCARR